MSQIDSFKDFLARVYRCLRRTALYIVARSRYIAAASMIVLFVLLATQLWLNPDTDLHIPSCGTLSTTKVKAYWDESQLNETKEIRWGIIYPGSSYNNTFFLQSLSNAEASFELSTGNWTFRNSYGAIVLGPVKKTSYMNLTWNYDNRTINPEETMQVTLTLTVTDTPDFVLFVVSNDVEEFSVDIVIRAV